MAKEEKQAEKKAPEDRRPPAAAEAKSAGKPGDGGKPQDGAKAQDGGKPQGGGKAQGGGKPQEGGKAPEGGKPQEGAAAVKPAVRRKALRSVPVGVAHINATFNNTQVTISDLKGAVLAWSSAGRMGFKGTRKSTAYAATVVAQDAARQVAACRMQELEVRVQGPGAGRESAIRALQSSGLNISLIRDITPIPHNGCRPRKRRRV